MRWSWKSGIAAGGFVLAAGLTVAQGQVPGVPAAPAAPGAAAAAPVAAEGGRIGKMCAALDACRRKICASPAGAMLNNMTKPLTAMTGGIIPPFCPITPSAADLAKPGVAGTSDAIKKDALEAKMRRDKVRFLGTVDCRYYPDATGALIAALRTDGSECVRYEAALALSRGCCCNQKTIDALTATVAGTEVDGNPAERSVRVRAAAAIGLEHCLACYVPPPPEPVVPETPEVKPELEVAPPPVGGKPATLPPLTAKPTDGTNATAKKVLPPEQRTPTPKSVELARKTVGDFSALLVAAGPDAVISMGVDRSVAMYLIGAPVADSNVVQTSAVMPAAPVAAMPMPAPAMAAMPAKSAPAMAAMPAKTAPAMVNPAPAPAVSAGRPVALPAAEPMFNPPPVTTAAPPRTGVPTAMPAPASATQPAQPAVVAMNPVAPIVAQLVGGATATERHAAIRQLVKFDWRENPVVASGLLAGAKNDATAAVRVDCLRHLAAYQIAHPQVVTDLTALARDPDPWVRDEAAKALSQLRVNP